LTTNTDALNLSRTELHRAFAEIVEELTSRDPVVPPNALAVCRTIIGDQRVSNDQLPGDLCRDIEAMDEAGPLATYRHGAKRVASMIAKPVRRW
jgi:hypothetical protein